jgi:multidrug efflux pump subunit AcrB
MMADTYAPQGMSGGTGVLLRDVATLKSTTTPAEVDRYNMRRYLSLAANVASNDLGKVGRSVKAAIADAKRETIELHYENLKKQLPAGPEAEAKWKANREADLKALKLPDGVMIDIRGQLVTLDQVQGSLGVGLGVAVVAILLLLIAYFQSIRLALIAVASVPATLCGVGVMLLLTHTTLNLQSFMGAIMAIGVSVANAILVVTFAEADRLKNGDSRKAAITGGASRLRPILMTSCAMVAGMVPMALGFGDGGDQTAPLGRAVIGGLVASTFATLFVLPGLFTILQRNASRASSSINPDDTDETDVGGSRITYP